MSNTIPAAVREILNENIEIIVKAHCILRVAYPESHALNTEACDCDLAMHFHRLLDIYRSQLP